MFTSKAPVAPGCRPMQRLSPRLVEISTGDFITMTLRIVHGAITTAAAIADHREVLRGAAPPEPCEQPHQQQPGQDEERDGAHERGQAEERAEERAAARVRSARSTAATPGRRGRSS